MSQLVNVGLGDRSYTVRIGSDMDFSSLLECGMSPTVLLVTDSTVECLYGVSCEAALVRAGCRVQRAVFPAGERSKTLATVERLYHAALSAGMDRRSLVVALGGGVVGDVAGFMAATFLRGIRLVQVPTSLLAMVDSSVGGKTGVDLPEGKNLVGAFHQPLGVVADLNTLTTLSDRDFRSGLAEVVKYGVIRDADLFSELQARHASILARDLAGMESIVARCCAIKADVVGQDEQESGLRQILNFGHTMAHALETVTGYGRWLHGEAVSLGMVFAAEVSVYAGRCDAGIAGTLRHTLAGMGLPVRIPDDVGWEALRTGMMADKKTRAGIPRFVLVDELGSVTFGCEVSVDVLERAYQACKILDGKAGDHVSRE